MKRLIRWLARVFKADIVRVEVKEVVKEVQVIRSEYLTDLALTGGVIDGDLVVDGNACVKGSVRVLGSLKVDGAVTAMRKEDGTGGNAYGNVAGGCNTDSTRFCGFCGDGSDTMSSGRGKEGALCQ